MSSSAPRSGRSRRQEASDSSDSSTGTFYIANVKFRVVTPPRPMPLVCCNKDDNCDAIQKRFGSEFEQQAVVILSRNGINDENCTVKLTARVVRDDPLDIQPTIFIVGKWETSSARRWQAAVVEIKQYIDSRLQETGDFIDISVEMVDETLTWPKYISIIPKDDPLFGKLKVDWPKIKDHVFGLLETNVATRGHMTAISLFKLGFDPLFDSNPKTVYVSVGYDSPQIGWYPVATAIQNYLDSLGHNLQLQLEHNTVGYSAFQLVPSAFTPAMRAIRRRDFNYDVTRTYNTMVNAGEDIGTTEYLIKPDGTLSSPAVGTLGCWVQIKKKGEDWETMALTNYHVVRPALKGFRLKKEGESLLPSIPDGESPCWKGDKNGLWPKRLANRDNRNEPTTDIEHPARAKHNFSVTELLEEIKTRPTSARQNRLSDWIAFFDQDKHLLGNIWLASGYKHRTKPESRSDGEPTGRLDWALIQPVDTCRIGVNKLPTETNWDSKYSIGNAPDPVTFGNTLKSQGVSLHDFVQGGNVYKVGASTKWTAGEFSNFKTNCSVAEDGYLGMGKSGEYVVIGKVNNDESSIPFANKGDSGSVVWGQDGRVLGLLFEGQQPQSNDDGYSFVTPIEDVFDHIKGFGMLELGGAVVEDIRLA